MTTYTINTRKSLLSALHALRNNNTDSKTAIFVDSNAASLTANDWGALLSCLSLPCSIKSVCSIDVANISDLTVAALVVPHIAQVAQQMPNLRTFALRRAPLGTRTAGFVGQCLAEHPSLRKIAVEQCHLRNEGVAAFSQQLFGGGGDRAGASSLVLEFVDLGHNIVDASGCQAVADAVGDANDFPSLWKVELRGNNCEHRGDKLYWADKKPVKGGRAPEELPCDGSNLKAMHTGERCPFPTLDYLAEHVKQDVAAGN